MVLQSIRERLTGILAIFILGILVIPFAFVGVNSYFQSGSENLVARVNDQDISVNDFNQSFSNYRRRMQSMMGASFDPEQFESLLVRREHLDALIDEELLGQVVRQMDLDIDNERLGEQIRDIPAFQLDGEFSLDVYLARLASQGLSVKQFERDMRAQYVLNQLPRSVLSSSIATDSELQDFISLLEQKRKFKTILVAPDVDAVAVVPDEAAIQAYYDNNQDQFQSEEMVEIEYLELSALDIEFESEPDDEFLRSRFEQQKGRFLSPEQRLASHVLIEVLANADDAVKETARQEAQDIADRAREGEDFAALAGEFSDDIGSAATGGDLGWVEPGLMSETFEDALYDLTPESPVSDPVQTGFGWHVILLREIQPSEGMSFEEARAILVQEHHEEESEREFLEKADRLVDLIYEDPTTLDAAAMDLGLEVMRAGPFPRSGGEGIAANADVVSAAFSELVLVQGSVSDPVDLEENHIVMLRVNEHFPAATRPLEEVSDQIVEQIQQQEALDAARQSAEALLASLQEEGAELADVVEQAGYTVIETEAATRRNFVPDRTVVQEVFRMRSPAEGESVMQVVEADNGFALVILEAVTPGSLPEAAAASGEQYKRQIANSAASIEVTAMMRQLRDLAKIEIYEERLK